MISEMIQVSPILFAVLMLLASALTAAGVLMVMEFVIERIKRRK